MAAGYADPVLKLVKETPNTRSGMGKVVEVAEESLTRIDGDITDLLRQRSDLVSVIQHYAQLYRLIVGEELRNSTQLEALRQQPEGSRAQETARAAVMRLAALGSRADGLVTDEWLLERLTKDSHVLSLPWRNPKAVIATILTRSGLYEKEEQGKYRRVKEEGDQ